MRTVPHPHNIYIQINDQGDSDTLSASFTDDYSQEDGIDINQCDSATLHRIEQDLALWFQKINNLRKGKGKVEEVKTND